MSAAPKCQRCGREMLSRAFDLPMLTRLLGKPPKATTYFCVLHGPWPGLPSSFPVGSVSGSPKLPHAYNVREEE